MVGIWVALEPVTPDMGPLLFATGSHNSAAPASSCEFVGGVFIPPSGLVAGRDRVSVALHAC